MFKPLSSKHEMVDPIDSQRTEGGSEEKFDSQRTEEEMPRVNSTSYLSTTIEAKDTDRRDFRRNHDLQGPKKKINVFCDVHVDSLYYKETKITHACRSGREMFRVLTAGKGNLVSI